MSDDEIMAILNSVMSNLPEPARRVPPGWRAFARAVERAARAAAQSEWFPLAKSKPDDGEVVLVMSEDWEHPRVLRYTAGPIERFRDGQVGRWYWYPERMRWCRLDALRARAEGDGEGGR